MTGTITKFRAGENGDNLTMQLVENDGSYWTLFLPKQKGGTLGFGVSRPNGTYEHINSW